MLIYLEAPGAGIARAGAQSRSLSPRRMKRVVAGHASVSRAREQARKQSVKTVATRTVATLTADARSVGLITLTLTLASRYAALASERDGLSATVTLTFTAPGHATLRESIPVTFLRKVRHSRVRSKATQALVQGGQTLMTSRTPWTLPAPVILVLTLIFSLIFTFGEFAVRAGAQGSKAKPRRHVAAGTALAAALACPGKIPELPSAWAGSATSSFGRLTAAS